MSTVKKILTPEEKLAARKAIEAAEKAEVHQALMSLYIPLSLFLSCCIFAAGVFMVYYGEPAGWGFIATTGILALTAFIALIKFQNKFRAKGIIPSKDAIVESNVVDASPTESDQKLEHLTAVETADQPTEPGVTAAASSATTEGAKTTTSAASKSAVAAGK